MYKKILVRRQCNPILNSLYYPWITEGQVTIIDQIFPERNRQHWLKLQKSKPHSNVCFNLIIQSDSIRFLYTKYLHRHTLAYGVTFKQEDINPVTLWISLNIMYYSTKKRTCIITCFMYWPTYVWCVEKNDFYKLRYSSDMCLAYEKNKHGSRRW